jgi:hypothetical protein
MSRLRKFALGDRDGRGALYTIAGRAGPLERYSVPHLPGASRVEAEKVWNQMTRAQFQQQFIAQLDELLTEHHELISKVVSNEASLPRNEEWMRFLTRARAAIHRIAGRPSVYVDQCEAIFSERLALRTRASLIAGVLSSLRSDVDAGYLVSHMELVHGEVFADFLEMSQHLLDEGYKDAAAVIAGSSLEAHLRQLCHKAGIHIETETVLPKKADRLNAELAGANVYSKLDQKNVTAWLDLRNKAAHGHYEQYEKAQVALLISGVRDFITRNPA